MKRVTDGRFTLTGPMGCGDPGNLGACALIEVAEGIGVMVVSRKMQALDQAILRHVGVEPGVLPFRHSRAGMRLRPGGNRA